MSWFIRTILFFVFMPLSYYFVLPNVVLSGIISLLLVIDHQQHKRRILLICKAFVPADRV